jgi:hypothetical protein
VAHKERLLMENEQLRRDNVRLRAETKAVHAGFADVSARLVTAHAELERLRAS